MSDAPNVTERPKHPLWWRILRGVLVICGLLILIPIGFVAGFRLLHDPENMPLCGKETFINVLNWYDQHATNTLPNVDGKGVESLAKLIAYDSQEAKEWNEKYQYIPGLRKGDTGDSVLMYMKIPTRWVHHAAGPPSIFNQRRWVLVPLDFTEPGYPYVQRVDREIPYRGESFERVSSEELESRLRKTLQFLQDNDRPHWQTVIAENKAFLKTLDGERSAR